MNAAPGRGPAIIWAVFGVLFVLHHDFWNWDNRALVLGWLPVGLAWHVGFSVAAGLLWAAATRWAWPAHIEVWADETDEPADGKAQP
ncbi:MAG: hypothetical protein H7A45_04110 [Verrucomicrobiales bacterium]|nr:hypothetical protein [Verrucomicrobiales bacterium]